MDVTNLATRRRRADRARRCGPRRWDRCRRGRDRAITWRRTGLDRAQEPHSCPFAERLGGGPRDLRAGCARRSESAAGVEVVDGGEGVVDRRGLALEDRLQVGAVVADRPVACSGRVQRLAVDVRDGQPGEKLPHLRRVRAARLVRQRRRLQRRRVVLQNSARRPVQRDRHPSPPARRDRSRVL